MSARADGAPPPLKNHTLQVGAALAARLAADEAAAVAAEAEARGEAVAECEMSATAASAAAEEAVSAASAEGAGEEAHEAADEAQGKAAVAAAALAAAREALVAPFTAMAWYLLLDVAAAGEGEEQPLLPDAASLAAAAEACPQLRAVLALSTSAKAAPEGEAGTEEAAAEGAEAPPAASPVGALASALEAAPVRAVALIDAPFDPEAEPVANPPPAEGEEAPAPLDPPAAAVKAALARVGALCDAYDGWRAQATVYELPAATAPHGSSRYAQLMDSVPPGRESVAVLLDCVVEQVARDAALAQAGAENNEAVADDERVGEVSSVLDAAFSAISLGGSDNEGAGDAAGDRPALVYEGDAIAQGAAAMAPRAERESALEVDVDAIEARMLSLLAAPGGAERHGMPTEPALTQADRGARRTALSTMCTERSVSLESTERLALLRAAARGVPEGAAGSAEADAALRRSLESRSALEPMPAATIAQVYASAKLLRASAEAYYPPDDAIVSVVYDAPSQAPAAVPTAPSFGEFVALGGDAGGLPSRAYDMGRAPAGGLDAEEVSACAGGALLASSRALGGTTVEAPGRCVTVGLRGSVDAESLVVATTADGSAVAAVVCGAKALVEAEAAQAAAAEVREAEAVAKAAAEAEAAETAAADEGDAAVEHGASAAAPAAEEAAVEPTTEGEDATENEDAAPEELAVEHPEDVESPGEAEAAAVAAATAALEASLNVSLPGGLSVVLETDGTVTQHSAAGECRSVLSSGAVVVRGEGDADTKLLLTDGSVAQRIEVGGAAGWHATNAKGIRWSIDAGAWVVGAVEYDTKEAAEAARDAAVAAATLALEEAKAKVAEAEAAAAGEESETPAEGEEAAEEDVPPSEALANAEKALAAIGGVERVAPRMAPLESVSAAVVSDPDSGARVTTRSDLALVVEYQTGHTLAQHADGTAAFSAPDGGSWRVERQGFAPVSRSGQTVTVDLPNRMVLEVSIGDGEMRAFLAGEGTLVLGSNRRAVSYAPEAETTDAAIFEFDVVQRSVGGAGAATAVEGSAAPRVFVFSAEGNGAELLTAAEAEVAVARAEAAAAAGGGVTVAKQPLPGGGEGVSLLSPVTTTGGMVPQPRLLRHTARPARPASALRGLRALPVPSVPPLPDVLSPGETLPPLPRCVAAPPADPASACQASAPSVAYRQLFIVPPVDDGDAAAMREALDAFAEWDTAMAERTADQYAMPEQRDEAELAAASDVLVRAMALKEQEAAAVQAYSASAPEPAKASAAAAAPAGKGVVARPAGDPATTPSVVPLAAPEPLNYFLSEEGLAAAASDPALQAAANVAKDGAAATQVAPALAPTEVSMPPAPPQARAPPPRSAPSPAPPPLELPATEPSLQLPALPPAGVSPDADAGGPIADAGLPVLSPRSSKFDIYGAPRRETARVRSTLAETVVNERFEVVESPVRRTTRNSAAMLYRASEAGATAPQFALSPAHLRFGSVKVGATKHMTARLTNVSPELGRYAIKAATEPFAAKYAAGAMAAGMSGKVDVSFTPTEEGHFEGEVTVACEYTILTMRVSGEAVQGAAGGEGNGAPAANGAAPIALDETKTVEIVKAGLGA